MMNRSNNQRGPRLPGGLESVPVTARRQDDLTGGPAVETVRFAFEGTDYEIDLNAKNAAAFGKRASRPTSSMPAGPVGHRAAGAVRSATSRQRSGDIRAWAKEHGLAVSGHGRTVPASVVEQYHAAAEEPGKTSDRRPARTRRSSRS